MSDPMGPSPIAARRINRSLRADFVLATEGDDQVQVHPYARPVPHTTTSWGYRTRRPDVPSVICGFVAGFDTDDP
jgi:hypothetical protein